MQQPAILLGIDTGGTFTDFVMLSRQGIQVHKVLSTPENPGAAIVRGLTEMGLDAHLQQGNVRIIHGTTVATNAVLEGKGVPTVYITNKGFRDTLLIGRQARPHLYDLQAGAGKPLAADDCFIEVDCRVDALGQTITALDQAKLAALKTQVEALSPRSVAINLLFSFVNDAHEKEIETLFQDDYFVSRSSYVLPEYKEFERGMATWINAWIGPLIHDYFTRLASKLHPCPLSIMQSSGVTIDSQQAARRAVNLLLSGPAGGVSAAAWSGKPLAMDRLMTFDMGGTSTDVALFDQRMRLTDEGRIGGFPIAIPMVDIHTIGAGGGSIASVDAGGLLQVGPASAGASPGPACYGQGSGLATVTDANLLLGRLLPDAFLGGEMLLSREAAIKAITPLAQAMHLSLEETAQGIVQLANNHMTQALREISVAQGYDPKDFTLVSFGGAGGLHFCALAEALEIKRVLVPNHAGVFSALGMLTSQPGRQLIRTHREDLSTLSEDHLREQFRLLTAEGTKELIQEGCDAKAIHSEWRLDLRYVGQTFTLDLPFTDKSGLAQAFHERHQQRYGHQLNKPVEVVNLRVRLHSRNDSVEQLLKTGANRVPTITAPDGQKMHRDDRPAKSGNARFSAPVTAMHGYEAPVPVFYRAALDIGGKLQGPCLVVEPHATHFIKEGWHGSADKTGSIVFHYETP